MLAPACYQPSSLGTCEIGCDGGGDTSSDQSTAICAGGPDGLMESTCFDPVPRPTSVLAGAFDTDATECNVPLDGRTDVCIIAAESISIQGTLLVTGSRPLVLWSASTISMSVGTKIDIAAHGLTPGAGSDDASCPLVDGNSNTTITPELGAGGCGGPFGGAGGAGGAARNKTAATVITTCAPVVQALDRVRGGCRGGHGGISNGVGSLNGGLAGGAVYLMARGDITVAGTIDARGERARPANANPSLLAGGGGGGSGGLIAFETPATLNLDGSVLNALGGGGSSGTGSISPGTAIQGNGGNPAQLSPPVAAPQAANTVTNNVGGAGSNLDGDPGGAVDNASTGGGGGGAGGVGYIKAYPRAPVQIDGAEIVPALSSN